MRFRKAITLLVAGAIGAAVGAGLLAAGSRVQAVGWHLGFPIAGALAGATVGVGMAVRQVRTTTAATLAGATIPPAIVELSSCDGSYVMVPMAGAFVGWAIAVLTSELLLMAKPKERQQGTSSASMAAEELANGTRREPSNDSPTSLP
ncbi:MAG: hypothetical protein ABIK89_21230 [Planctomycetota bacterium]